MAYMPAVLMAAGIAVLSLWENPQAPLLREVSDKILHVLLYAIWAVTIMCGILSAHHHRWTVILFAGVCATLYGGLMELLQAYCTHTRSGEWLDVVADMIGVIIGFAGVMCVNKILQR